MKTSGVIAANLPKDASTNTQLIFSADKGQWLNTVTAGQILKGRVLKAYSDHKYGVMFGGQERIVDSAIPLTVGATLTGSVTSVKDTVVSMKMIDTTRKEESNNITSPSQIAPKTHLEVSAANFGVALTPLQVKTIASAANATANVALAINVGLYLVKLGIPVSTDLIRSLTSRILFGNESSGHNNEIKVPIINYQEAVMDAQQLSLNEAVEKLKQFFQHDGDLSETLQEKLEHLPFVDNRDDLAIPYELKEKFYDDNPDGDEGADLSRLLNLVLNINTQGSINHRLKSLPLVIDGRLVEFDVAFFDQKNEDSENKNIISKSLRFSLETDFGKLNLVAKIVNDRISLSFASISELFLEGLKSNEHALVNQLVDAGWKVDAVNFIEDVNSPNAATAIIDHVLQQDSFNIVA